MLPKRPALADPGRHRGQQFRHTWRLEGPTPAAVGHQNAITDQNQAVGGVPFYLLLGVPR